MLQDLGMEAPRSNRRFVEFTEKTQHAKSNLKNYREYKFALMKRREDELHWQAPSSKRCEKQDGAKPNHSVACSATSGQAKDDDEPLFSPRPDNWNFYLASADQDEELQKNEEEKDEELIETILDRESRDDELRGEQQLLMLQSYNPDVFADDEFDDYIFEDRDAATDDFAHTFDPAVDTTRQRRRRAGGTASNSGKCTHVVKKAPTIQSPYFKAKAAAAARGDFQFTNTSEQQRPKTPTGTIKPPKIKIAGRSRTQQRPSTSDGVLGRPQLASSKWSMGYKMEVDQSVRPHTKMDPFSKSTYTMRSIRTYNRPAGRLSRRDVDVNKRPPKKSNWGS
jgi:hypothetical protein